MTDTVTLTIDGAEVTVPRGTSVIEAAKQAGKTIPHFCYHPGLPVDGNCRMCIADIRTWNPRSSSHMAARRPAVACWTEAEEQMLVFTDNDMVRAARKSVMEFLLVNHPVDCPICDKAGECMLQDYYMQHDRQRSELRDDKVHKPRLVRFGERIVYNAERCILCARCTRFTTHVSKTHELGIVNRGDRAIVELHARGTFDNAYTDCVADICPVGALTKTDFRFKKRVWFLKHTPSVCGGCSRNCNTVVDHDGAEIIRIMPRERKGINDYWMCNEGRDLYKDHAALRRGVARVGGRVAATVDAVAAAGAVLAECKEKKGEGLAFIASPWMSDEEAWLAADVVTKKLKCGWVGLKDDRVTGLPADDVLHTDDHNPNRRGVLEQGLTPGKKDGKDLAGILTALDAGEVDVLVVWGPGLVHHFESPDAMAATVRRARKVVQLTDEVDAVSALADVVVPLRTWAERDGSWTNFEGHGSRFRKALRPPDGALDGVEALAAIADAGGVKASAGTVAEVRKKMKAEAEEAAEFRNGRFEFPKKQTLYRHVGGVLEV